MKTVAELPKSSLRSRATEDDFAQLRLFVARTLQQQWVNDSYWDRVRSIHRALAKELSCRQWLQRLARRYRNDPLKFCEKAVRRGSLDELGKGLRTRGDVQAIRKALSRAPDALTHKYFYPPIEPSFIEVLKPLTWRPVGRKRLKRYEPPLEFLLVGEYPRNAIHEACKKFVPNYGGTTPMSSAKRLVERRAMRSGLVRLLKTRLKELGVWKFRSGGLRFLLEALHKAQEVTKSKN